MKPNLPLPSPQPHRHSERNRNWATDEHSHSPLLIRSAIIAVLLEGLILTSVGWENHWLAHPKKNEDDPLIETQILQLPQEAHLVEKNKASASSAHQEVALSKAVRSETDRPSPTPSLPGPLDEENQTEAGPQIAPNHGPIAVYAPTPEIPPYLQNKELKTSVIIEFRISAQGSTTARLVGSSGNEELDAIAIETVKKWQFRAAEKEHQPIESKVRLRIKFEVK